MSSKKIVKGRDEHAVEGEGEGVKKKESSRDLEDFGRGPGHDEDQILESFS